MGFINNPGIILPGPKGPKIGPQYNPMPQVQPNNKNQARIMTNSNTANTNQYSTNNSNKTDRKVSGRREGGKVPNRRTNNKVRPPIMPVPFKTRGFDNPKAKIVLTQSDFGYNIDGSSSPNEYVDGRDQTLFRDYNERSQLRTNTVSGQAQTFSQVTNQFKLLDINPAEANGFPGYLSQMMVILDVIRRDVVSSTRAAKGAIDALAGLEAYLNQVTIGFALLIQIEALQSWNPTDNAYFDRSFRLLASKMSSTKLLELRTQLRQVLIPHVLPVGWMKYIKWIYGAHLRNHCPESTKLRFVGPGIAILIGQVMADDDITDFETVVTDVVTSIRNLNQSIPAIMLNNSTEVDFANCKDWYDGMHNSAVYDAEWNNIFNNRVVAWSTVSSTNLSGTYPKNEDNYYICLDTTSPYSMVLAQASRQAIPNKPGLPLEGVISTARVYNQVNYFNRFCITENDSGVFRYNPVTNISLDNTDSIHRCELLNSGNTVTLNSRYSMPAGIQSLAVIASDANCFMAARESLSNMTLK